jgi:hypothetical protein
MTVKLVHIAVCMSLLFSINCYSASLPSKCFDHFAHGDLPFEIYAEGYENCKKDIQPFQNEYGLSTNSIPFIDCADEVTVAPLCNGNFIAVWKFSHHRFPVPLTGRIFDSNFKTLYADFPISEKSETEDWEHSVSTLYDDGFVVTWKTRKTTARKEIKLRGRIFDNVGNPRGKSFDIYSTGRNNGCFVYGLPKGGFVVVWNNSKDKNSAGSALLRIFDVNGKPRTKEIIVASESDDKDCLLKPRGYITKNGNINVFMTCQSQAFDKEYFFHSARGFTEAGKPLTSVLMGDGIQSLEGYSNLREQHIKQKAIIYDVRLRHFKKRFKERQYCHGALLSPHLAYDMKTFTNDQRMKDFFTNYCADYTKYCIVQKFEEKVLDQCLQK